MTRGEMTLAEWLYAHAGVVEAGIRQGDLNSHDFDRDDVAKLKEAARLLAERDTLAAQVETLRVPQIDCPRCGATVRQVSSATLSLALWQHFNWVCQPSESAAPFPPQEQKTSKETS